MSSWPLRIIGNRAEPIDESWNYQDVCTGEWRLYCNDRLGAEVRWDLQRCGGAGSALRLEPGRLYLIPAWVAFSCAASRKVQHRYLHFDVAVPRSIVEQCFAAPQELPRDAGTRALTAAWLDSLAEPGADAGERALALCYWALSRALSGLDAQAAEKWRVRASSGRLAAALALIEDRLGEKLTLAELAKSAHVVPDHLIRVFKSELGTTPARYIRERRVARAAVELLQTQDSIDIIAERTGFSSRFHFSRVFSELIGCAPAQFRNRGRV